MATADASSSRRCPSHKLSRFRFSTRCTAGHLLDSAPFFLFCFDSGLSNYDRLNRNTNAPEYNHLDRGNGAGGSSAVDYQAPVEYDHLDRSKDAPEYNHLDRGGSGGNSAVDYQAPAEYDHLDRSRDRRNGADVYEVALPDGAQRSAQSRLPFPCIFYFVSFVPPSRVSAALLAPTAGLTRPPGKPLLREC